MIGGTIIYIINKFVLIFVNK